MTVRHNPPVSSVPELIILLDQHRKQLNRLKTLQLNSAGERSELRGLVEGYFEHVRPKAVGPPEVLGEVDRGMRELLELCHRRGSTRKYLAILKRIKSELIKLDTAQVSRAGAGDVEGRDVIDHQILVTLRALLPSAALSYEQALVDLSRDDRLSWRGPATDLREALRESLDHLAPDKEVKTMPGFKQLKDTSGPTMKQKVRYILRSRGLSAAETEPAERASESVEEAVGGFVRSVYTRSAVSTHTPTDRAEVLRVRDLVRVALCELLEIRR